MNIGMTEQSAPSAMVARYATAAIMRRRKSLVGGDHFKAFRFKKNRVRLIEYQAAAFVKLFSKRRAIISPRLRRITMRSDFLGDCAQFRDLPEAINDGQYLIPRLTRDQLRQVIESPAKIFGAQMSPVLVTNLLNDIGDDQDQLPVLQHSLMRTWNKWAERENQNSEITLDDYESRNYTHGLPISAPWKRRFQNTPTKLFELSLRDKNFR